MFITFEGPDGSGKSTQAKRLYEHFKDLGREVELIHFPNYNGPVGKLILDIIQGRKKLTFKALEMLYVADQLSFQEDLERMLYDERKIVIADRYDLSTLAYYISKTGVPIDEAKTLIRNKWQSELRKPDITFVIDFKGDLDIRRGKDVKDKDLFETDLNVLASINNVYKELVTSMRYSGERSYYTIDGSNDEEKNAKSIANIVETEETFITKYMLNDRAYRNKTIKPF